LKLILTKTLSGVDGLKIFRLKFIKQTRLYMAICFLLFTLNFQILTKQVHRS
jgi:hypothetical protein